MSDLDQLKQRFDDLFKRYESAKSKKEQLKGELSAKQKALVDLSKEIEAAGHDPRTIKAERDKAEKDLAQTLDKFEKDLSNVEDALSAYDKQRK